MEANINYFNTIPDNILITSILPKLPLNDLLELCESNQHFNDLCQNELLWKHRMMIKFPELLKSKPNSIIWKDFYLYYETVDNVLPIYYHGDLIEIVPISRHYLNNIIPYILSYIPSDLQDDKVIVFIGYDLKILFMSSFPYLTNDFEEGWSSINIPYKMIISDNLNFEDSDVYKELTSPLGNPPIYGKNSGGNFNIIDSRNLNPNDQRLRSRGRSCHTIPSQVLLNLIQLFDYDRNALNQIGNRKELCKYLNFLLEQIGHII